MPWHRPCPSPYVRHTCWQGAAAVQTKTVLHAPHDRTKRSSRVAGPSHPQQLNRHSHRNAALVAAAVAAGPATSIVLCTSAAASASVLPIDVSLTCLLISCVLPVLKVAMLCCVGAWCSMQVRGMRMLTCPCTRPCVFGLSLLWLPLHHWPIA